MTNQDFHKKCIVEEIYDEPRLQLEPPEEYSPTVYSIDEKDFQFITYIQNQWEKIQLYLENHRWHEFKESFEDWTSRVED